MRLFLSICAAYIGLFLGGMSGLPEAGAVGIDPPAASGPTR